MKPSVRQLGHRLHSPSIIFINYYRMESEKAPESFAPENLIKTVIMICALKRHSVPRRHQIIDAPVSLDRRRGRRRRLASSLPYLPPVVRSSALAAEARTGLNGVEAIPSPA